MRIEQQGTTHEHYVKTWLSHFLMGYSGYVVNIGSTVQPVNKVK